MKKILLINLFVLPILICGCVQTEYQYADCGSDKECFWDSFVECNPTKYYPTPDVFFKSFTWIFKAQEDTLIEIEGWKGNSCKLSYYNLLGASKFSYSEPEKHLKQIKDFYCYIPKKELGQSEYIFPLMGVCKNIE